VNDLAHNCIFEVSSEKLPSSDWITEETFFDNGFLGSIADYMANLDMECRNEEISSLQDYLQNTFEFTRDGEDVRIKLLPGGKQKHFKNRFESFKDKVGNVTLNDFCFSSVPQTLQELINDRFSFYIYMGGFYKTIDNFIRDINEGEEFYIGGIVDYHY
jgi:hypothetical protein